MNKANKPKNPNDPDILNEIDEENKIKKSYNPSPEVRQRLLQLQKRLKVMEEKKKSLGITDKIKRMDLLFKPHLTNYDNVVVGSNLDDPERKISLEDIDDEEDQTRKSKPLAFQKITTAQATLIKQNVKVRARAKKEKYKKLNLFAVKAYEDNFETNNSKRELRKAIRDLGLYGLCYMRRYLKRRWRTIHIPDGIDEKTGKVKYRKERNLLVNKLVLEKVNPRNVLLDDSCTWPGDAKDCAIILYLDQKDFSSRYPKSLYPDATYVRPGANRMFVLGDGEQNIKIESNKLTGDLKEKIKVIIYENVIDDTKEVLANGVYLEKAVLPGHTLSLTGAKWVEDQDDYDGIGIGQVIELYQPIVDDILNAGVERLRQMVRPVRVEGNDVKLADDSDERWYSGKRIKYEGDVSQVKWDRPPAETEAEFKGKQELQNEIDDATGIKPSLEGGDESKTAFQAAQNKEEALKRLILPLDQIKDMLDEDANKFFPLAKEVYSEPEEVQTLTPESPEFLQAEEFMENNPNDERFVRMDDGTIARRIFPQIELNLSKEMKPVVDEKGQTKFIDTGRLVESEEKDFWEMIPEHFNWEGHLEIIPMSFLPTSEAIENEQKQARAKFLLETPTVDEKTGQPVLKDAVGRAYMIDKVKVLKDLVESTGGKPEQYVIPLPQQSGQGKTGAGVGNIQPGTLPGGSENTERELAGLESPQENDMLSEMAKQTKLPE